MVIPFLAAMDPRQRVTGTRFENMAEDVLNGILCHYEPPVSEYTQHKAAKEVRRHPEKYTFSEVKKSQSILRTSRLYRKRQAMMESEQPEQPTPTMPNQTKKAVSWRDEKNRKGIEGTIEGCATRHCGFLGFAAKGGDGLAEALSPTAQARSPKNTAEAPLPQPIMKSASSVNEPLNDHATSKKVLYDDEGNPIGDLENNDPPAVAPPAPSGLSQIRRMAKELDDTSDVYEPENYDQPSKRSHKFVRSATPRYARTEEERITMQRSQSPVSATKPNHYDVPEQFQNSRPATPYRSRGTEEPADFPASPTKKSEVFSDVTMDPALSSRNYQALSTTNTSRDMGMETYESKAAPMVRSKTTKSESVPVPEQSKSASDPTTPVVDHHKQLLREVRGRKSTVIYDEKGDIVEQRAILEPNKVVKAKTAGKGDSKIDLTKKSQKTASTTQKEAVALGKKETSRQKQEPTPRMSMEPPTLDPSSATSGTSALPPTPRRKDDVQTSQNTRSNREDRKREEEIRARLSQAYSGEAPVVKKTKKKTSSKSKRTPTSPRTLATDDEIRAEVTTIGMDTAYKATTDHNKFEYLEDEEPEAYKENVETRETAEPVSSSLSNSSSLSSIDEREPAPALQQRSQGELGGMKINQSNSGNSARSKNIWKGWKKTLGKVKKIVNDIDEQRLPASASSNQTGKSRR